MGGLEDSTGGNRCLQGGTRKRVNSDTSEKVINEKEKVQQEEGAMRPWSSSPSSKPSGCYGKNCFSFQTTEAEDTEVFICSWIRTYGVPSQG